MSLASVITKINKKYGEGTIINGSQLIEQKIERVTTGALALDMALGGGWPLNQWHEIIGSESSGKSVIAMKTIAANQKLDPNYTAFWVAAESLPMDWAQRLGVDMKRFFVHDTNVMEEAFDAVLEITESREVDCVVIDSLPALMPVMEDEQMMGEFAVGAHARLTGKFTRKGHKATKRSLITPERPVLGLIINQWRSKIGVLHGDPRTTPGGLAKNFFFFTRMEIRRIEWLTDEEKLRIGQRIKAVVIKNKSAPGQREGEFDFYFAEGGPVTAGNYDAITEIVNVAIASEIIVRKGRWYYFGGEQIADGRENLMKLLHTDGSLAEKISHAVLVGPEPEPPPVKRRTTRVTKKA